MNSTSFWILKTEPSTYSYADLERDKKTQWDGIRNYQARNNLKAMKKGDLCLIYESVGPKELVGTAHVLRAAYPDPKDTNWVCVDIQVDHRLPKSISLAELKKHKTLRHISLVKQSRLSVCPINKNDWEAIHTTSDSNKR